jgi:Tfp pilus assembly protein PilF
LCNAVGDNDVTLPALRGGLLLVLAVLTACDRSPAPGSGQSPSRRTPTFNTDVAPVLYAHCASCHRPAVSRNRDVAGIDVERWCVAGAPFSLLEYQEVRSHAREIADVTKRRSMPPWLPEHGYGVFADERRLPDDQIEMIQQWVDRGAIEGDASAKPPIPKWPDGWQLGQPDLVVKLAHAYTLPAGGGEVFRNFVIPVPISTTKYVRAIELQTDNPRILHHASVGIDRMRIARHLGQAESEPGFAEMADGVQNVFGWSPGKVPFMEPPDVAWPLDAGSDFVLQLHMLPSGKPEVIQPSVGLFLSDVPPRRVPFLVMLESKTIDIPAGQAEYAIDDSYLLPADVDVLSVYPHAHYLAKEVKAFATLPDGTLKWLLWIKAWDFRGQDEYRYAEPLVLPKGTTLTMHVTYDNSPENPRNPHRPPQRVKWGPHSSDEMGVLWLKVLPRHPEDAAVLRRDYTQRALRADVAGAEMQVRVDSSNVIARNVLATRYLQIGRVEEALAQLEVALRLGPDDVETRSNLGSALQMLGRTAEAVQQLREASRLAPGNDRVHFNLGNVMNARGETDEAVREFRKAIQSNPDNAEAHFNLALALGSQGKLAEAIVHLRRTLVINPQSGEAHRNIGVALGLQGKLDEAIEEAREALRIQPDSVEAQKTLSELLRSRDQRSLRH